MSRYLDTRPITRILAEEAYQDALREVRRHFARALEAHERAEDGGEFEVEDILEVFDRLFEPGMGHCEPAEGFERLLDALDDGGLALTHREPHARRLTGVGGSDKTRKPRVKRLAGG